MKIILPRFHMLGNRICNSFAGCFNAFWKSFHTYSTNTIHQEGTYDLFSYIHAEIIHDLLKSNHKVRKNASNWRVPIAHDLASLYIWTGNGSWFGHQDVQFYRVFGFWYCRDSRVNAS